MIALHKNLRNDLTITYRVAVKNLVLTTKDFKHFEPVDITPEELKKLDAENAVYLGGKIIKIRSTEKPTIIPEAVLYKNIVLTADPENDHLGFFDLSFPAEGDEVDLDFIVQKVKELYPDIVTELPKKPLKQLNLSEGLHKTYRVKTINSDTRLLITVRGVIIIREGYEHPKDVQKYIDYVLGIRDADDEIIEKLAKYRSTELFVDVAGIIGPAYTEVWRNTIIAEIYYDQTSDDAYYVVIGDDDDKTSITLPGGQKGTFIKTEKKLGFIQDITVTKENIIATVPYLDGLWKITIPWDYNGANLFIADTSDELPPGVKKEPVLKVPKAQRYEEPRTFYYEAGQLKYYDEDDEVRFLPKDKEWDWMYLSKDVLEAAETIEEAIELQKFLQ